MSIEERVTRALHDEADRIDVDVQRLHAGTRRRLPTAAPHRRIGVLAPLLVAALVLTLLGGIALLAARRRLAADSARDAPARAVWTRQFTCPVQITADEAQRRWMTPWCSICRRVPRRRHACSVRRATPSATTGDRALLRLGNADGSLAATGTFRRTSDGWDLDTTQRCGGQDNGISVPGTEVSTVRCYVPTERPWTTPRPRSRADPTRSAGRRRTSGRVPHRSRSPATARAGPRPARARR